MKKYRSVNSTIVSTFLVKFGQVYNFQISTIDSKMTLGTPKALFKSQWIMSPNHGCYKLKDQRSSKVLIEKQDVLVKPGHLSQDSSILCLFAKGP